jgi:hypothetical protein
VEVDQEDLGWSWTPLFVATENDYIKLGCLLLDAGASIHHVGNDGHTLVKFAAQMEIMDLVRLSTTEAITLNTNDVHLASR